MYASLDIDKLKYSVIISKKVYLTPHTVFLFFTLASLDLLVLKCIKRKQHYHDCSVQLGTCNGL